MSRWKIILNKTIWKNIGIIAGIIIAILIIVFSFLNIYTHHGQGSALPDFTGLTEVQLQHLIKTHKLRYTIIDSVHITNVPPGVVIEQVPKANELVKKNRRIFFTINAWTEDKVSVPNLMDYSLRNAKVILESFGLSTGELVYIPSEYSNLILGQHLKGKPIQPGSLVPKGTAIDLLIGRGLSSETTSVPGLLGLDIENARKKAQSINLNIGATIFDEGVITPEDSAKAFVWKQNPEAQPGSYLNLGASIDVWLTVDESLLLDNNEEIQEPEDNSSFEDEIK